MLGRGTPHGFGNDAHSQWLRSRPPAQALTWVERACGVRILGLRAYRGGSSSAIHGLRVQDAAGHRRTLVLRRYVMPADAEEEPDIVQREEGILRLLRGTALPTPDLLAADSSGAHAGVPASS